MKLWSGRFKKETDKQVNDFNSSIRFDKRLYKQDIEGSMAHVDMLSSTGIIGKDDGKIIKETLAQILEEIEQGKIEFKADAEDIHMNIETILIERIGDTGKKLHTARSRNDQVALDLRMYVKAEKDNIISLLLKFEKLLITKAEENLDTIMPGYTHLQRAQPITFAHHLMAYAEMIKRDIERFVDCGDRLDRMPLGSGALAGTTYPIDREKVKDTLGFNEVTNNSLDGVSDRDFVIEFISNISIAMMHLSRFSEEIILWCSTEFGFIELDDAYSTGSSIMPQKKNPDIAELVRGKTGRVYGDLMTILTVMKGLPLAYNKDMQEDKEAVFDAIDTVKMCIEVFAGMIDTMKINSNNMMTAASGGFTNATDLADYLVKQGMPFRTAHAVSGKIVSHCIDRKIGLEDLTLEEYKKFDTNFNEDVYKAISISECVKNRKVIGGPAKEAVLQHIEKQKAFLNYIEKITKNN